MQRKVQKNGVFKNKEKAKHSDLLIYYRFNCTDQKVYYY